MAIKTLSTLYADGDWVPASDVWAYSSSSGAIGVVTVSSGAIGRYSKGYRVRVSQTTDKYFVIINVTDTTITLFGGTDYTLANADITSVAVSAAKSPAGFPSDRSKWTIVTSITTMRQQSGGPTSDVWYASGNEFVVPAGDWHLQWWAVMSAYSNTAASTFKSPQVFCTLSTGSATESWADMTGYARASAMNSATGTDRVNCSGNIYREKFVELVAQQTLYANYKCVNSAAGDNDIIRFTDSGAMVLAYTSVYL